MRRHAAARWRRARPWPQGKPARSPRKPQPRPRKSFYHRLGRWPMVALRPWLLATVTCLFTRTRTRRGGPTRPIGGNERLRATAGAALPHPACRARHPLPPLGGDGSNTPSPPPAAAEPFGRTTAAPRLCQGTSQQVRHQRRRSDPADRDHVTSLDDPSRAQKREVGPLCETVWRLGQGGFRSDYAASFSCSLSIA